MLRPAVAATNWARAGKTSGLDMGKRRLSVQRKSNPAVPGTIRSHKVPGWAKAVNGAGDEAAAAPAAERDFCPDRSQPPTKLRLSCVYQRLPAPFMLMGARKRRGLPNISFRTIGWFPMDTSHLAEHAGAASSFFASIFVVATLSMRTMIPLRVFAILTN